MYKKLKTSQKSKVPSILTHLIHPIVEELNRTAQEDEHFVNYQERYYPPLNPDQAKILVEKPRLLMPGKFRWLSDTYGTEYGDSVEFHVVKDPCDLIMDPNSIMPLSRIAPGASL